MKTRARPEIKTPAGQTLSAEEVIADYRLAVRSRAASVIGRREVLTGKAPFGIFGDGKEVAQLAMAKVIRDGDWRSGYYRDQTVSLATGVATLEQFFAQLYTDTDVARDPFSAGRQMVSHFATRNLDPSGEWRPMIRMKNSAAELSPVASQMARALGLAYASKLYRQHDGFRAFGRDLFSRDGNEVCFATVGNAGCAEGIFWEALNAAGVLQVPLLISVWDDGYGISVPNDLQVTKSSISELVRGFAPADGKKGVDVHVVRGWDYAGLVDTYAIVTEKVRRDHAPALIHVIEMTQPQGHSTSGSHERYKTQERLRFETEMDPIGRMRRWMIREEIATAGDLDGHEREDRRTVERIREEAYQTFARPILVERERTVTLLRRAAHESGIERIGELAAELERQPEPGRRFADIALDSALVLMRDSDVPSRTELRALLRTYREESHERFRAHVYSTSARSPLRIAAVPAEYAADAEGVDGRLVLVRCFDQLLVRDPRIFIIGEDVGRLGDVNLVFEGLQAKHGDLRLTDTGIREATILGQGIGAAMRGLRPVVDIQYLDYLLYALELAADDIATLRYRTAGGQMAPVVIRTKGHRLQGIWHTGSPMAMLLGALPGVRICVPRNMTQAAGMYNTLFASDDPAVVIEVLSGYRIKERMPSNLERMRVALGMPEVIRPGRDVTVVTYGAMCRVVLEAAATLTSLGIEVEAIDLQTLDPLDLAGVVGSSVGRTGALVVADEDIPGGASAHILRHALEVQGAQDRLEVPARTVTAVAGRTPVGQDGDHYTKPNASDVVRSVYAVMRDRDPRRFGEIW
jgi:pyruvate/2-oxoglutarate/acetoin dehydrogenase E1 component/TPP-dependent pyruvate/acetoin dehydrogenase alpha subunit